MIDRKLTRPSLARVFLTASLLLAGLVPLPAGWARTARETARSLDRNRGDRAAGAGGYYEGLIAGEARDGRSAPDPLGLCLVGDPIRENRDLVKHIIREQGRDFLQFDLKPGHDEVFFGGRFTTNSHGMSDREYPLAKPEGTYRIALLGSSIDMGWGVSTPNTYENLLEDWLNAEAARRGLSKRFEILNFSVVAYSPEQRYDVFCRKALPFAPDLVLFSSTMLDPRLVEIHLGGLIKNRVDLKYDFFREAVAEAGIDPARERSQGWTTYDRRNGFKARVKDHYWTFADAVLGTLAADCRSLGIPLACLQIPRASRDEANDARALAVARQVGIAARHAVPMVDLSDAFDPIDSAQVEVAPGDDHPNTLGHRILFDGLRQGLLDNPALAGLLLEPNS
ncbi:SGNH/GDSL hydrolase family protein [Tundrisphaera lichenicola]|uniref:SGNH/GDSL hydrolase family protein n=1 Tax=Tundrisphaera lichenicola TaxID=2029860 RepID=UPI003EB98B14